MGQTEIKIFIVLIALVILIFIIGIVLFVFQYRKRRLTYEKERTVIEKQHKLDLLNNQLLVQQQTMQFIGSEIHDSVAQKLTLASIYSQKLEYENKHPDILDKIGKISLILNDSLTELRELAKTLTSNIRDEPLTQLLLQEKERINDAGICTMQVNGDFTRDISINVKSFLLRIIQEFIQNSLKHSACTVIKVILADKGTGLFIEASDNGKGFDTGHSVPGGIGLSNMKRRIQTLGGIFKLISEPEKGTVLEIFIENKNLLPE